MIDVHAYDTGVYCDDRIFDCLKNLTVQTFVHTEPFNIFALFTDWTGADLGGGCRGAHPPPPPWDDLQFSVLQLVFCKKKTMWFIGVEVEQETSAPPPKKNPGSAPVEHACWAQQRKQETSARRFTWNKVRWNFNFFIGFTICPCAERYFRNGVCRLSYHASMRPLVWIRYSIGCPNRDAVLHMFCVVETHLKSLSRNENNGRVLLH